MATIPPEIEDIKQSFHDAVIVLQEFCANPEGMRQVALFAQKTAETLQAGNKIISCGNGGSMCDAMHFAEELTGRFREDRPSLPAIAISDPSYLTCTANDYGFDFVFSRFVQGVGRPGDLLLGISTSGNSPNVLEAVREARKQGMYTVCLLGKGGGTLKSMGDLSIVVPGETSDRIQELHIKIIHITIETAERLIKRQ